MRRGEHFKPALYAGVAFSYFVEAFQAFVVSENYKGEVIQIMAQAFDSIQ